MFVTIPKITIQQALAEEAVFIDVRTPKEFAEFHIPGAINVPIFTNEERAQVGTIYKQIGQEKAIDLGVKIFSKKLQNMHEQLKQITKEHHHQKIIVYCWRGGMRSGVVVSFFGMLKLPLIQLEGGIRSYRKRIQAGLEAHATIPKQYIVIEGNTGTHKTDILRELQKENYPVIDLEGLAGHRGSIFGGIGQNPKSQKEFERDLLQRLNELKSSPYFIVEAESRRIGKIVLPDFIMEGKDRGIRIHLNASIESRIRAICNTYCFDDYFDEFVHAMEMIKKRMKPNLYNTIMESFQKRQYDIFVKLLLEQYYDPKYTFACEQYESPVTFIEIEGLEDGVEKVKAAIQQIMKGKGKNNAPSYPVEDSIFNKNY